jgi:oligopeptide/dipeptide ABC transporter ATP-binding protein
LDASIQAQILNLLMDLHNELGLTYLFIAHNLGVVKHISDRVAVMYLGKIVELGETKSIFSRPSHPYTAALLSAAPIPDPKLERASSRQRIVLHGEIPSAANPPTGCRFHTRCWLYQRLGEPDICRSESPPLGAVNATSDHDTGHVVACHFASQLPSSSVLPAAPSVQQ